MIIEFEAFPKIGRLRRDITVTEKIDGSNAAVVISDDGTEIAFQSRTRIITPGKLTDNFGFAQWGEDHRDDLLTLGPGRHFGEWYGVGIQRGYGLKERRFALFNAERWRDGRTPRPACCDVVPILYEGEWSDHAVGMCLEGLRNYGSLAVPGWMKPEGVVVYHKAVRTMFKVLLENDDISKTEALALAA